MLCELHNVFNIDDLGRVCYPTSSCEWLVFSNVLITRLINHSYDPLLGMFAAISPDITARVVDKRCLLKHRYHRLGTRATMGRLFSTRLTSMDCCPVPLM